MASEDRAWPFSTASFARIRTRGLHYVDKTGLMWKMANHPDPFYFLGRPRRFGKSLLTTTLEAYFLGKRELFVGLEAERLEAAKGDEAWHVHPVLRFDMSAGEDVMAELHKYLDMRLSGYEAQYGIDGTPFEGLYASRFENLIEKLATGGKPPVVLIDEYDHPLAYTLGKGKGQIHKAFKELLRSFYSVLKRAQENTRFVLFTGVSQFQQVSVFSGLNNIRDITLDPAYATICGITRRELEDNFDWRVRELAALRGWEVEHTYELLASNYDGFRFSEVDEPLFNPFSVIRALADLKIRSYWLKSGVPYVLQVVLPNTWYNLSELEKGVTAKAEALLSFNPGSTDPVPILFQAGYLSIKGYDPDTDVYSLSFPNKEVRYAFYDDNKTLILGDDYEYLGQDAAVFSRQVNAGDVRGFMTGLRSLLANVPYHTKKKRNPVAEVHFQTALFLVLLLTGKEALMEVPCESGRPDIVLYTDRFIYIFELKIKSTPRVALQQIIDRDYALRHAISGRKVIGIGMNFDPQGHSYTWLAKPKGEGVFGPEEEQSL